MGTNNTTLFSENVYTCFDCNSAWKGFVAFRCPFCHSRNIMKYEEVKEDKYDS